MSSFDSIREDRRFRQISAYGLAVILPILSSILVASIRQLQPLPFAPHFFCMAFIAMLGGLGPAITAVVVSVVSHNYLDHPAHPQLIPTFYDGMRASTLLSCALVISLMNKRRHRQSDRLEMTLAALQDRTDALIQSLHNSRCASWTQDIAAGESRRWYSGSYPIFGRPFAEVEKLPTFIALLHPDDRVMFQDVLDQMNTSWAPLLCEYRIVWPDGEVHWLESRGTRDPESACLWRGVTVDITERKLAETALIRSEKLAAMGRLASTVAHEINNPLEAVTNLLFLARTDPTITSPIDVWLETAERELARLANITRLTLGFVRTSAVRLDADLGVILDEVLSLFRHRPELKNIQIVRASIPDESGVRIGIAAHELRQILTNLISNAADALSGDHPLVRIHIVRTDETALLLVEDNGSGIPESQLTRIFDPFFTTKEDVGTGIGLWVTRELVEKNSGRIWVESGDLPDGMKTRFSIEFPLASAVEIDAIPTS